MSRSSNSQHAARALRVVSGHFACAALLVPSALLAGCAGGNAAAHPTPLAFDAARAWAHLEAQVAFGPRPSGSAALEETRLYLERELAAAGLAPKREAFVAENTPAGRIEMTNVYADLPGRAASAGGGAAPEPPIVILASHFDTKSFAKHHDPKLRDGAFVGANDGASSTAVLLELARVLAAGEPRPVTYRFLFLDGEEAVRWEWNDPDNRYGSRHHAQALQKSGLNRRVCACVVIDMVGDANLVLTHDSYSDQDLLEIFFSAARRNGLGAHVDGRTTPIKDDHLSFMAVGIPSCDLIDLEYEGRDESGKLHDWWHTLGDTIDKCSPQSLDVAGRIVLLGLPALEERCAAPRR